MDGILTGERVANFRRLDHTGKTHTLYLSHYGQPMVLIVLPAAPDSVSSEVRDQLLADHPVWERVARLGLIPAPPEAGARFHESCPVSFPLLADDGAVCRYLAGDAGSDAVTALVLDTSLRLLRRVTLDSASDGFAGQVAAVYDDLPASDAKVMRDPAPVLILPRVFEPGLCDELIETFNRDGGQPSGVLYLEGEKQRWQPNPDIKIRRDFTIQTPELADRVRKILGRKVIPEIQRVFSFQVTRHEPFKLVRYSADTGGYFRPHRDNVTKDVYYRRFAMTLNLNDTDSYQGGQLRFPEFGPHLYQPPRGGAIVFSCSLVHEAMDVSEGVRYAMLAFYYNEESMKQPLV